MMNFLPPDLPGQVSALVQLMSRLDENIRAIRANTDPGVPEPPAESTIVIPLTQAAASYWSTNQLVITGLLASADTAGRYALTVGNDTSLYWRMGSNLPCWVIGDEIQKIVVARGLQVTISAPNNTNWDVILFAKPGLANGATK